MIGNAIWALLALAWRSMSAVVPARMVRVQAMFTIAPGLVPVTLGMVRYCSMMGKLFGAAVGTLAGVILMSNPDFHSWLRSLGPPSSPASVKNFAGQLRIYSPQFQIGAGGQHPPRQRFTARCESGVLANGGFEGISDASGVSVAASYPSDAAGNPVEVNPVAWTIEVYNTTASAAHRVHVDAGCLTGAEADVSVVRNVNTSYKTVTATCPNTTARTSGGYTISQSAPPSPLPPPWNVAGSYPQGSRGWAVEPPNIIKPDSGGTSDGTSDGSTITTTLTAYAVCLTGIPAPRIATQQVNAGSDVYNGRCDGTDVLAGGGFHMTAPYNKDLVLADNGPSPDSAWFVRVHDANAKLEITALCLPGPGSANALHLDIGPLANSVADWLEPINWSLIKGLLILLIIFTILGWAVKKLRRPVAAAIKRRRESRPAPVQSTAQTGRQTPEPVKVQVIIRSQHSVYGTYRETP